MLDLQSPSQPRRNPTQEMASSELNEPLCGHCVSSSSPAALGPHFPAGHQLLDRWIHPIPRLCPPLWEGKRKLRAASRHGCAPQHPQGTVRSRAIPWGWKYRDKSTAKHHHRHQQQQHRRPSHLLRFRAGAAAAGPGPLAEPGGPRAAPTALVGGSAGTRGVPRPR